MIEQMIDSNEKILWRGQPDRLTYAIGSPGFLLFALIWGVFDLTFLSLFFKAPFSSQEIGLPSQVNVFAFLFFLVHMSPVWAAIFGPIYRFFAWNVVEYVLTDKRIYMVSGLIGRDIQNVELYEITQLSVDVGWIEAIRQVGTVRLTPDSGSPNSRSSVRGLRLSYIEDPYRIYKQIKQLSLDVTTDHQYPNAYRPEENPGYQTRYGRSDSSSRDHKF